MRVALISCNNLPEWEVDDQPFRAAIAARGVEVCTPAWDDPAQDWAGYDACVVRTTWDYWDRGPEFLAWVDRVAHLPRLFNPGPVLRWNLDKRYLRALADAGIPIAPTVWLEPGDAVDVAALMAARGWQRGFFKPVFGACAAGTLRFDADADGLKAAQAHIDDHLAREAMMLQPYLPQVETFGEVSALLFDGVLSHGVRKIPVPGDYRVQDDFGATDEPYAWAGDELALAQRTVDVATTLLDLDAPLLYARADFLRGDDGALLLTELELVEPSLFFRHDAGAADRLAEALMARLSTSASSEVVGERG